MVEYLTRDTWKQPKRLWFVIIAKPIGFFNEYTIDEHLFTSTRLSFTEDSVSELGIPAKSKDYPVGKQLRVYYHPDNPADAVIYLEIDYSAWGVAIILFVMIMGLYFGGRVVLHRYLQWMKNKIMPQESQTDGKE